MPDTATEPRFMMDHMLVRVGKYLRILGYDAEWDLGRRTRDLIGQANREARVFVTCNRHLRDASPRADRLVVLNPADAVEHLYDLVEAYGLDTAGRLFSLCVRCNVPLERVASKEQVKAHVEPNVYERYRVFYTCPRCATVFWQGSHVRNTCAKLRLQPPCGAPWRWL